MLRYAHVLDGAVLNVSTWSEPPTEEQRASYAPQSLIACTGLAVAPGWSYADGVFAPPPEPVLYRYAATQYGFVFGVVVLDHEATPFDEAQALPRTLVACPEEVQIGWRYDEATGAFSEP